MNDTYVGCLRKISMQSKEKTPDRKYGMTKCSDKVEKGAFFYGNGGYIRLCTCKIKLHSKMF